MDHVGWVLEQCGVEWTWLVSCAGVRTWGGCSLPGSTKQAQCGRRCIGWLVNSDWDRSGSTIGGQTCAFRR